MDNLVVNAVAPWQGYLHWVGNVKKGNGKNGEYAFADFTLKYTNSKMQEKYITFTASNVDAVAFLEKTPIGTPVKVQWFPDAQEATQRDRWYPKFSAYSISLVQTSERAKPSASVPQSRPAEAWKNPLPTPSYEEDLPDDGANLPF